MRTRRSQSSSDPVSEGPTTTVGVKHRSVLLHEAVSALQVGKDDTIVDATLGGAGHAREIAKLLGPGGFFVGFDLDSDAISRAEAMLADAKPRTLLINANFRHLARELQNRDVFAIDKALFDLGWSSYQLQSGKGFSFTQDEPLLMTYGNNPDALTAKTIVNEWEESSIADVIYGWGGERYSRRIAKAIVERRTQKPFATSRELADAVVEAVPAGYRRGKIHPATKTFQALRIAVNDELGALKDGLENARTLMNQGGRVGVISFHSVEDRLVKRMFAEWEKNDYGIRITKKPLVPSKEEIRENRRARSAKLRVFQTTSNHDKTTPKNQQI